MPAYKRQVHVLLVREISTAANEDIRNFLFATALPWELQWNLPLRKWCSLYGTAHARHRAVGGHACCPFAIASSSGTLAAVPKKLSSGVCLPMHGRLTSG